MNTEIFMVSETEKIVRWYKQHRGHPVKEGPRQAVCQHCSNELVVVDDPKENA